MKLTNKLFFVATAALVAFACTKEIDSPQTADEVANSTEPSRLYVIAL